MATCDLSVQKIDPTAVFPLPLTIAGLLSLPDLETAIERVAASYDFHHHPYLLWMQASPTSREAFRTSQLPFRFAVESFSQSLAAVLARIPQLEARLPLLENVVEEHGQGNPWHSHKYTFRQYLLALGVTMADLEQPCTVPVLAFNQALLTYCLTQPAEVGAALLGTIEYLYIGISATIARTLHDRQWAAPGSQSHYAVHEHLDVEHARDLLHLAVPFWQEVNCRRQLAQSLLLAAHYFWSLYRDLLPCNV